MRPTRTGAHLARTARRGGPRPRVAATGAVLAGGLLALSACSSSSTTESAGAAQDDTVNVVTSTSVYADVVEQIGGDGVTVTPVIDSAAQDPHSYEATPQDRLTVEDADLVVMNGGGYDGFMDDLIGDSDVPVVDAVEVSGLQKEAGAEEHGHDHAEGEVEEGAEGAEESHDHSAEGHDHAHDHGGFNEHVWYDLPTMQQVAGAVGDELAELDADSAQDYGTRAQDYGKQLDGLHERAESLGLTGDFIATEPVAGYLLEDAGLHDATPEDFTASVESGSDIAPLVYQEVADALGAGDLALLAYNEQTAGGQTDQLRSTAEDAGVPVVSFTETIPEGQTYPEWMSTNIDALDEAL